MNRERKRERRRKAIQPGRGATPPRSARLGTGSVWPTLPWRAGGGFRRRAVAAIVALAALGALFGCFLSPAFRVNRVEVVGNHFASESSVVAASGLVGANVFAVDPAAVRSRVLSLALVEGVDVGFRLPSTAIITVRERAPAYLWKVDPTLYLVSADGTVLGPTTRENQPVIVVDADRQPVEVGGRVDARVLAEADYLTRALPVVAGLSPHYLLYSRGQGLVIPTADGIRVAVGDDLGLPDKLAELRPVLDLARAQRPPATLVDLRFTQHPYFR